MISIIVVSILAEIVHTSHVYRSLNPGVLQLPNKQFVIPSKGYSQQNFGSYGVNQDRANTLTYNFVPTVSYSLSHQDYNYLKRYTQGIQGSQNGITKSVVHNFNTHTSITPQDNSHSDNGCSQWKVTDDGGRSDLISDQSVVHDVQAYNVQPQNHETYSSSYATVQDIQPVITKDIYFHVPPPDIEEQVAPAALIPLTLKKKTYNIIFIKTPSQHSSNLINLQEQLAHINRNSFVDDKTLIYVLVKKPEEQIASAILPESKILKPEVFFVKYRDSSNVDATLNDAATTSNVLE